jgi:ferritin-like metal-binding protein YciE
MDMNNETSKTAELTEDHKQARDQIVAWLRDAYALERGLEASLVKVSHDDDVAEAIQAAAALHLEETEHHAEGVKGVLQSLGEDTSSLKTALGRATQAVKGIATQLSHDQPLKDLLDAYAMEHLEIAIYTAIEAAAERADLPQVAELCKKIIPEEERMGRTLLEFLPQEVGFYLFDDSPSPGKILSGLAASR